MEDKDTNHLCDYGCKDPIGEHADSAENEDRVCDYGCGVTLEPCENWWGEWVETTAPFPGEDGNGVDGVDTRICTICSAEDTRPATGYAITFNSNGGSAVTTQVLREGTKATKPADNITRAEMFTVIWRINNYYKTNK